MKRARSLLFAAVPLLVAAAVPFFTSFTSFTSFTHEHASTRAREHGGRHQLDGLGTLGQFTYYDAMVVHGPGTSPGSFDDLRKRAMAEADTPSQGGSEKTYLDVFLDIRRTAMKSKNAHRDTTRIDTAQRKFLYDGNLNLDTPLEWKVYGETYRVP